MNRRVSNTQPWLLTIDHHDNGVHEVSWHPDGGRPDVFLVAHVGHTDPRWWPLVDALVAPTRRTVGEADELAIATCRRLTGCELVAVGVRSGGYLLRARGGDRALTAGHEHATADGVHWAALGYAVLVSGGTLGTDLVPADRFIRRTRSAGAR